ncbi:unnamed protein product, partial [Scytosiphon promiscuus]
ARKRWTGGASVDVAVCTKEVEWTGGASVDVAVRTKTWTGGASVDVTVCTKEVYRACLCRWHCSRRMFATAAMKIAAPSYLLRAQQSGRLLLIVAFSHCRSPSRLQPRISVMIHTLP